MKKSKARRSNSVKGYRNFLGIIADENPTNLKDVASDCGINHNAATAAKDGFVERTKDGYRLRKGVKPTLKEGENLLDQTNEITNITGWIIAAIIAAGFLLT